jgi:aminoglycoside 3-N-acetyltransferase
VSDEEVIREKLPVTGSQLVTDLSALGVRRGGVVMVHSSMSALGWVVGGTETVVRAMLDQLGADGTLMAYASWEEIPIHLREWPAAWQRAYREELPPFDPRVSEARHDHGRVPERIRTWPGAERSPHPEASVVAVGAQAHWLTAEHPSDDAYGRGTPFARLVDAGGQVLVLGAPLGTLTLLHHAEALAEVAGKRRVAYEMPVVEGGRVVWREFHRTAMFGVDEFEVMSRAALEVGAGRSGRVGQADSHLFEAAQLVRVGVNWLETHFGRRS